MSQRKLGLIHLLVVYLTWGSTFLAIRIAVRGENSFQPFTLAAARVGAAGVILLAISYFKKERLLLDFRTYSSLATSGLLYWFGGHALLIWASQWVDSGYSALIFASIPLWTAVIEGVRLKSARSSKIVLPVISGFFGIILLTAPAWLSEGGAPLDPVALKGTLVLLLSALSWAVGTVMRDEAVDSLPVTTSAGYQQLFAAIACLVVAAFVGERPHPISPTALLAWVYLFTVGSLLAFSSFVRARQLLPVNIVSSFAYVNPVIAVLLGAWVLKERVTGPMIGGMALVIFSVVWLFRSNSVHEGEALVQNPQIS